MWKAPEKVLFLYLRMQFVYPSFLYALGFIAIPIIIHLFNLVRPKKVIFSNTRFLKQVELKTSRKLQLKHLLILLTRILFISFLVLIFAQPFIANDSLITKKDKPIVSIYIDNSQSMSALKDDQTVFNLALKEAEKIINQYPSNTKFQIIDNNFKASSNYLHQKEKALDYLTEIQISNSTKSAEEIYKRQLNVLKKEDVSVKQVIWLTDAQECVFGKINQLEKDTTIEHMVFEMGAKDINNISIDTVYLGSPFVKSSELNTLFVKLKKSGAQEAAEVNVKLTSNGNQLAQVNTSMDAESSSLISMQYALTDSGSIPLMVEMEDGRLNYDNIFNLILTTNSKINILAISDSSSSIFSNIYKNEKAFDFQYSNISGLDYALLKNVDLIILEELHDVPKSLAQELSTLTGTEIFIIPSASFKSDSYKYLFSKLNLGFTVKENIQSKQMQFPDLNNPFFKGIFTKSDKKVEMPVMNHNFNILNGSALLKFQDGSNALIKNTKVYISAGDFSNNSNSFIKHSFVVPLMYKIAMESSNDNKHIYYTIGSQNNIVRLASDSMRGVFTILNKDVILTPDQVLIGKNLHFKVNEDNFNPGFYELKLNNKTVKSLAFNVNLHEGDLTLTDHNIISEFNDRVIEPDSLPSDVLSVLNTGIELWKYCVLLALLFFFLEILLIRFYKT